MKAAQKAISRLQNWWLIHYSPLKENDIEEEWTKLIKYGAGEGRFPPINGIFTKNFYRHLDEKQLPALIAWAWLLLLGSTVGFFLNKRLGWNALCYFVLPLLFGACAVVMVYLLARHLFRQESKKSLGDLKEYHPKTLASKKREPAQEAQAPLLSQQQGSAPKQNPPADHQQPGL